MTDRQSHGIRNIALVGSYLSGKTSLLESLLATTKAIGKKGSARAGNTVGNASAEARTRQMGVELNAATCLHGDVRLNLLDCPGSVEFASEGAQALMGVDAALVVVEPGTERLASLASLFDFLDARSIPHLLFVNKIDLGCADLDGFLQGLRDISARPIALQQCPVFEGAACVGVKDLVTDAFVAFADANADADARTQGGTRGASDPEREAAARDAMLELLADHDAHLMEEILNDETPSQDEIVADLRATVRDDALVPCFFGSAERDWGVTSLLDALVAEVPEPAITARRRGIPEGINGCVVQILKNTYIPLTGKVSLARVWNGPVSEGMVLNGQRVASLSRMMGMQLLPVQKGESGDIVALGRLERAAVGETLCGEGVAVNAVSLERAPRPAPVYWQSLRAENRNDEVKLSAALGKLVDEDSALSWEQRAETREIVLCGQGEVHLALALERLRKKYNVPVTVSRPRTAYRETSRRAVENVHGRYKHQTGGHGQFGDVRLNVRPLPRGSGVQFDEKIVGGVVPRQFIPGVEMGVREACEAGPLGFPVVDIGATLVDGSYHSVDSSEQAFKLAARQAMNEALAAAEPMLLEPIARVRVCAPREFTARVMQILSARRGQILGYDVMDGIRNWEEIAAHMPSSELNDFILELRAQTGGAGWFETGETHLDIVPERLVERISVGQGQGPGRRARAG